MIIIAFPTHWIHYFLIKCPQQADYPLLDASFLDWSLWLRIQGMTLKNNNQPLPELCFQVPFKMSAAAFTSSSSALSFFSHVTVRITFIPAGKLCWKLHIWKTWFKKEILHNREGCESEDRKQCSCSVEHLVLLGLLWKIEDFVKGGRRCPRWRGASSSSSSKLLSKPSEYISWVILCLLPFSHHRPQLRKYHWLRQTHKINKKLP